MGLNRLEREKAVLETIRAGNQPFTLMMPDNPALQMSRRQISDALFSLIDQGLIRCDPDEGYVLVKPVS